jgi:hypothetical protein
MFERVRRCELFFNSSASSDEHKKLSSQKLRDARKLEERVFSFMGSSLKSLTVKNKILKKI